MLAASPRFLKVRIGTAIEFTSFEFVHSVTAVEFILIKFMIEFV